MLAKGWALVALGLVLCFGSAQIGASRVEGPSRLLEDSSGRLWLLADRSVHRLSADGALEASDVLRVPDASSPLAELVVGGERIVVFDAGRDLLISAALDGAAVRYQRVDHSLPLRAAIAVEPKTREIYGLTRDGEVRRLCARDEPTPARSDEPVRRSSRSPHAVGCLEACTTGPALATGFVIPVAHAFDPSGGALFVADAATRRVVATSTAGAELWDLDLTDPARPQLQPVDLSVRSRGELAVGSHCTGSDPCGRVHLIRDGALRTRFDLPDGVNLSRLLLRERDVLVVDGLANRILRFDLEGRALGSLGDSALESSFGALAAARAKAEKLAAIRGVGPLLAFVPVVIGFVLIAREHRRQRRERHQDLLARLNLRAITPPPAVRARRRRLRALGLVCLVVGLFGPAGVMIAFHGSPVQREIFSVMFLTGLLLGVGGVVLLTREGTQRHHDDMAERFLGRSGPEIVKLLEDGERIRLNAVLFYAPRRFELSVSGATVHAVLTDRRLLLLKPRLFSRRVRVVLELRNDSIESIHAKRLLLAGTILKITQPGSGKPVELRALSNDVSDALREELMRAAAGGLSIAGANDASGALSKAGEEGALARVEPKGDSQAAG